MLPTSPHSESVPFLLVHGDRTDEVPAVQAEDLEPEPPAARSVPPHTPPSRHPTAEADLPSVIVDLAALPAEQLALMARAPEIDPIEEQRASDVDFLLEASDPSIRVTTTKLERRASRRGRGFAIATLFVIMAAGGTFAGLRAHGVPLSARAVGAALHLSR